MIGPIVVLIVLLGLPFFAGEGEKSWRRRPVAVLTVLLLAITLGAFTRSGEHTPWSPEMNAWSSDPIPFRYQKGRSALERRGALVLQVQQCRNCHSLDGLGGKRGPALDSVAVRLTHDQLIGQAVQGGGNMPAYGKNLSPPEPRPSWPSSKRCILPDKRRLATLRKNSKEPGRDRTAMVNERTSGGIAAAATLEQPVRLHTALGDYWALTKPEVNFLILITTGAAFYLGDPAQSRSFPFGLFAHTLLGTLLVASGGGALNQFAERRFDAQMRRTSRRPIPAGRIEPSAALRFGIVLSLAGAIDLAITVNLLASFLAILTSISYLFVYTPLKRRTSLCTLIGALAGAMPPLIGWVAASGSLTFEAWMLYALLFLWQLPDFMAIAGCTGTIMREQAIWFFRSESERAGS